MYNSAKQHYENHLASFYTWMTGDFEMKVAEQQSIFESFGIRPFASRIAFDLGAGTGIQSMALAQAGYRVMAVDFNDSMLAELQKHNHPSIECKTRDILEFFNAPTPTAELIVCMGDTLIHFDTVNTVKHVITKVMEKLCSGGKCMLSFRDLTMELKGPIGLSPCAATTTEYLHVSSSISTRMFWSTTFYMKEQTTDGHSA